MQVQSKWLAELLIRQHSAVTKFWIEDIRNEDIPSYRAITDEQLQKELPPTVDSMISAFQTGDIEGPRQHALNIIRHRLAEGFRLMEFLMSLHALATAVMQVVQSAAPNPEQELEAVSCTANLYYIVSLLSAELYEQLRVEQQERFSAAYEFGITLSKTLNLSSVLDIAVHMISKYASAESVAVLLEEPRVQRDQVAAHLNIDADVMRVLPEICTLIGCSAAYMRETLRTSHDVRSSKSLSKWAGFLAEHGYLSVVCVPLLAKNKRLGSFVILRPDVHEMSDSEMDFLLAMLSHTSSAIQNAQLYEEAQGKRELGILYEASKLFASSLDTQDILNKIAKLAAEVLEADIVIVHLSGNGSEASHQIAHYASGRRAKTAIQRILEAFAPGVEQEWHDRFIRELSSGNPMLLHERSDFPEQLRSLSWTIKSGLVAPLKCKEVLFGAFILASFAENAFSEQDLSLAMGLAELATVAIDNARSYEYERKIAETLQRSFLPSSLPSIDGYEVSAYYRPAMSEAEVGGDFYDIFPNGSGDVSFVIGDVSGKGLNAAVQTAMGKYMVRAYATEDPSPGNVLARFNRTFLQYSEEGQFLTVFYGLLSPGHTFTYASAGHNPPLMYSSASDTVSQIDVTGICLGVIPDATFSESTIDLDPGDAILLYTDGATDVKKDLARLEIEGLAELFLANVHAPAEEIVRGVFDGIYDFGQQRLADDVALLVIKRRRTADCTSG